MGNNLTVVVLSDALADIANDLEFGRKLFKACDSVSVNNRPIEVSARGYINAAHGN